MKYDMVKLKELCTVNQGLQIPISKRFKEPGKNRFFYITVQFLKESGEKYYIEKPPKSVTCTEDEILVVRTGNTGQVITGVVGCFHNNFFKVTPNEKVFPKYLYYALNNKKMHDAMLNAASGTTIPDLKHSSFYDLEIPLPDINIQKKIATILDNICDKLKLNTEINNNLSEQIRSIYNEIFTEFVYYKRLDEISNVTIGKTPPRSKQECFTIDKNDVKWISISDLGKSGMFIFDTSEKLTQEAVTKYNVKVIPKDTVILSFKLTVGRTGFTTEDMTTNEAIAHFDLFDKDLKNYLYCTLTYFNYSDLGSTSSIATAINSKIVKSIKIGIPSDEQLNKFNNLTSAIFKTIKNNESENIKLSELRDTLLPKLMNGEIDLDNIEI